MYEQYENKLKQIRNWIHRFRFVILAVVLVSLGTFLYLKGIGIVYSELQVKRYYTYGETVEPSFSASVKKKVYHYRDAENPNAKWTDEVPKSVGSYEVKGEIISLFGIVKNAGTKKFYIRPKNLHVTLSNQAFYDNIEDHKAEFSWCDFSGLQYNDKVSEDISFLYIPVSTTEILYEIGKPPVIQHEDGSDASDCYTFQSGTASIKDAHIYLTIETGSNIKTYSGNPKEEIKSEEFSIVSGKLRDGDTLTIKNYPIMVNYVSDTIVPNVISEDDVVIKDASGNNVTEQYILTIEFGELALLPRKLVIRSGSAEKFYDGTPLTCSEYKKDGELAPGDSLEINFSGKITDPGMVDNTFSAYVKSEQYINTTSCYYLEYHTGTLTVYDHQISTDDNLMFEGEREDGYSLMSEGLPFDRDLSHDLTMFRFMGNKAQVYYFRKSSFDVYTGKGWQISENSKALLQQSCFEAGRTLERMNAEKNNINVKNMRAQYSLLPYFSVENATYDNNTFVYKAYNWNGNYPSEIEPDALSESILNDAYANYMSVPENVKSVLLSLGEKAGISANDQNLVEEIAVYIQNSAKYNLHFAKFPENEDMVIYFLTKGKEGICQHYAAAATLMYRTYGIPARYVIGFANFAEQYEWGYMNSDCGHAWVEIYLDNFGWIPVEVTGPDDGSSGVPTEKGNDWFVNPDPQVVNEREYLYIKFSKFEKEYDGLPVEFNPQSRIVSGNLILGDTLETTSTVIEVLGNQIGTTKGSISYQIYDQSKNDVTDQYIIYCDPPYVKITERYIEITTFGKTGQYDDGTLENNQWYISKGSLANGDSISVKLYSSQDETGTVINVPEEVKITNSQGNDVTKYYNIQYKYGDLTKERNKDKN